VLNSKTSAVAEGVEYDNNNYSQGRIFDEKTLAGGWWGGTSLLIHFVVKKINILR